MEINISNYEVYIIDYLDNKLGPVETAQLLLFLENHPGLKDEFEDLKTLTVNPSTNESFGFNESLKQPNDLDAVNLSLLNYTHYFIADAEGDLTQTGRNLVSKFLEEHPELVNDYKLFKACKLAPDKKVKYSGSEDLKIIVKPVYLRYYLTTGIAASLLLLITIFLKLTPESENTVKKALQNSIEVQMNNDGVKKPVKVEGNPINTEKESDNTEKTSEKKFHKATKTKKEIKTVVPETGTGKTVAPPIRKIEKRSMMINHTPLITENKTRNFYTNLYDDIRLAQELSMAEQEDQMIEEESTEKIRGVAAGRILNSVISSGEQLAQQLPESMNGWLLADMGIKGFNLLTNNNYTIDRTYSNRGNIQQLKIKNREKNL